MSKYTLTESQHQAVTRLQGRLFIAAGAGSGKTGVVTNRFVYAVATGYATVDEILTITFTRKAAAVMMRRIRDQLRDDELLGAEPDEGQRQRMAAAYRGIERAQISTIDSFCASVLRANALAAGLDPEFSAADESQALLIREEAFDACLSGFVKANGEDAVEFIRCYDANLDGKLFKAILGIFDQLRSQGQEPVLPVPKIRLDAAEKQLRLAIAAVLLQKESLPGKPTSTQAKALDQVITLREALDSDDDVRFMTALKSNAAGKSKLGVMCDVCTTYNEALDFFLTENRSRRAMGTLLLFQDLLTRFAAEYEAQKRRLGLLDFSDLAIRTRNLLLSNQEVRGSVAARYKLVMVDEFQDTNPLQKKIVELLAGDHLLMVGDKNQSIYGFRDAVVELFQEEEAEAKVKDYRIELAENFRSQSEILDFVDFIFNREEMLGDGYIELKPSAKPDPNPEDACIEVLLIDEGRTRPKEGLQKVDSQTVRAAEAQLIAERLTKIFAGGKYSVGDVAVLVREAAHAEPVREALTGAGIECYLAAGRSYFQKLDVGDAINIFRLIVNPLDDIAMLGALRSPMVGLSDDALYWLRAATRDDKGRPLPLWKTFTADMRIDNISDTENMQLRKFTAEIMSLRAVARREPLQAVARRVIDINDYAAVVAAQPDGKQRLANLMMLIDLAADFGASWGDDLLAFTDYLIRQKEIGAKQADAPTEEEGVNAVRIMTMHTAKGLEFPLVVLPHLSWKAHSDHDIIKVDRQGRRVGIKCKTDDGYAGPAFDFSQLQEEEVARGREEEHRLGYVAMTRAKSHLILSGAAPVDGEPKRVNKADPPLDWLREYLGLCWNSEEEAGGINYIEAVKGVKVRLEICVDPGGAAQRFTGARLLREAKEQPGPLQTNLEELPAAAYIPPVVSPTSIDIIRVCPRRYYLERVLDARGIVTAAAPPAPAISDGTLNPTDMGTLVHALLEKVPLPLGDQAFFTRELDNLADAGILPGITLNPADREKAIRLATNITRSQVVTDINNAAVSLERELSFSTMMGPTILRGQMDVFVKTDDGSLVVDYKTGEYGDDYPDEKAKSEHSGQMAAYALVASRIQPGPVEVVIVLLREPVREVRMFFNEARIQVLEAELQEQLGKLADGEFTPLSVFDSEACAYCQGNQGSEPLCVTARSTR